MSDSCHHSSIAGWWTQKPKVDNASLHWQEAMQKPTHFNCGQPYCHLSSFGPLSFTFDLTFLTPQSSSAAALTAVDKEGKEKVVSFFSEKRSHMHTEAHIRLLCTHSLYHLQNICLPSNVASKAACYLDCISFLMFQLWYGTALLQRVTHAPATVPESLQASVLHVPTIQMSFSLSEWSNEDRWYARAPANIFSHEKSLKLRLYHCAQYCRLLRVCPEFRKRAGELRHAYQYCHLSNRHFVCLLTQGF